jgi:hypothetical protein
VFSKKLWARRGNARPLKKVFGKKGLAMCEDEMGEEPNLSVVNFIHSRSRQITRDTRDQASDLLLVPFVLAKRRL